MTTATVAPRTVIRSPLRAVLREGEVIAGIVIGTIVVLVAFLGPLVAPYSPYAIVGPALYAGEGVGPFGTDSLGRDVLSRVLSGGGMLVLVAVGATALGYAVGFVLGLLTGYNDTWWSGLIMRGVDVLLAFPPLLFLLLIATGAGRGPLALLVAIAIIHVPSVIRIVRGATQEQAQRSFVEAAVVRGESQLAIVLREIAPNIARPLLADAGLRLTWSVLLIASASYLGLGAVAPEANWALMISENQSGIGIQPWAVLLPAIPIVALTFSVNLILDGLSRRLGVSSSGLAAK
jgi:peptide/nickel transport system permease protein